jgi:hypothetical protein
MKKYKNSIVARSAVELASALGLKKEDALAMEFRARLEKKIIDLAQQPAAKVPRVGAPRHRVGIEAARRRSIG